MSTLMVPARGDSVAMYQGAAAATGTDWTLVFIAVLGWVLALIALVGCCKLALTLGAGGGAKHVRTVGVQTSTTFRRRYATPRMGELNEGKHGIWID